MGLLNITKLVILTIPAIQIVKLILLIIEYGFHQLRQLKKGDELSYDYGYTFDKDDYKDHICKCGYKKCVGYIISSDDWKKFSKHISKITKR